MPSHSETFLFTALPAGRDGSLLKLSVLISPRLSPSGKLGDFDVGNWPERMKSLALAIEIPGFPPLLLPAVIKPDLLDPKLWDGLFPASTPVIGWDLAPYASRQLRSFPSTALHDFITNLYSQVASDTSSAAAFPSVTDPMSPVGNLVSTVGRLDEIVCSVVGQPGTVGTVGNVMGNVSSANTDIPRAAAAANQRFTPPSLLRCGPKDEHEVLRQLGSGPPRDFFLAKQFYDRPNKREIKYANEPIGPIPPPPSVDQIDFHKAIALLGDHPRVLRMLGLILDLEIDLGRLRAQLPAASRLRVKLGEFAHTMTTTTETPWTNYQLDEDSFFPAPRGPGAEVADGMLRLGKKGAFQIQQVDVDGAALNVLQFATNQRRYQLEGIATSPLAMLNKGLGFAATPPGRAALPALRGGGITIARVDRKGVLQAAITANTANNLAPSDASLYADDLTRGYRIDVLDADAGKWRSLCRRHVKYTLPGVASFEVDDEEGYVKGSAATSTDGAATDDVYVHEAMFGWSGWSLVAQRPGQTLSFEHEPMTNKTHTKAVPRAVNRPPAELVMNGTVPYDVQTDVHAQPGTLPRLRYGRKYKFRARAVDMAGNSRPLETNPPEPDFVSPEIQYRRFEPVASPTLAFREKISLGEQLENMVVRSRVNLDPMVDAKLPPSLFNDTNQRHVVPPKTSQNTYEMHSMLDGLGKVASYNTSKKENGTLQDPVLIDETTGMPVDVSADMKVVKADGSVTSDFPMPGGALAQGSYVLHTADEIRLPYLPDPMAPGAAFLGFPKAGSIIVTRPYGGSLPSLQTLRLVLKTGSALDFGPAGGNVLGAVLPPGTIVHLRYSSMVEASRLDHMAVWDLMTAAAQGLLKPFALQGVLWMLSPYRELQLVHAVERPLQKPALDIALVDEPLKALGQTYSRLEGKIGSHAGSTGEAEIAARWIEVEDRLDDFPMGAHRDERLGHITNLNILYPENDRPFPKATEDAIKHEFGDTKHRWVEYRAVGTTRYREYFPTSVTDDKDLITLPGDYGPPAVPPVPFAGLNVLSTARPAPPQILYIVPTFEWRESADKKTRQRVGRGLRVYLERPWFVSGDGERLAAVLTPAIRNDAPFVEAPVSADLRKYVSEWGADPVTSRPSGPVRFELRPQDFVNDDKLVKDDLTLHELHDDVHQKVRAVGFNVEYNSERQLWFCDIEMDPGMAYYPYVRLALARLQPDSIDNAHLSPVVRTEFAQLVADRTANIQRLDGGAVEVFQMTVVGFSATTDLGDRVLADTGFGGPGFAKQVPLGDAAAAVSALPPPTQEVPPGTIGPPFFTGLFRNPAAGAGHSVRAHIERRPAGMPAENDLGWEVDSDEVTFLSYTFPLSAEVFWKGELRHVKKPMGAPPTEYRLVIQEFEIFETDTEVAQATVGVGRVRLPMRERLVYLDVFPLGTV